MSDVKLENIGGNITITPPAPVEGMSFSVKKKQGDVVAVSGRGKFTIKEGECLIINLEQPTDKEEGDE